MTTTSLSTFTIEMFMTREMQFCSACWSRGKRIRCANVAECVALRQKYGQVVGMRKYRAKRRASFRKHFAAEHPEIQLKASR